MEKRLSRADFEKLLVDPTIGIEDKVDAEALLGKSKSALRESERVVVDLSFGIGDGRVRTVEEIGSEFGVSRERVRQVKVTALRKLRGMSEAKLTK